MARSVEYFCEGKAILVRATPSAQARAEPPTESKSPQKASGTTPAARRASAPLSAATT